MKTFINKSTNIKNGEDDLLGYANLAIVGLNTQPKGGFGVDDMRKRIKVMDKLDNLDLNKEVDLEDAELELIVSCSNIKWPFMHKDVIAFSDYLIDLSKT